MTSEVAGDPTTLPGLRAEHENGPRRPGASPPMRMTASWFIRSPKDRPNTRPWRAMSAPPQGRARLGFSSPTATGARVITRNVKPSRLCDAATNRCPPAMRRVSPKPDASCRRARGRQGRCAPLTRWPEDGPSLTATVRAGTRRVQVGAEGWCRSNKRMGRELVSTGGLA